MFGSDFQIHVFYLSLEKKKKIKDDFIALYVRFYIQNKINCFKISNFIYFSNNIKSISIEIK